MSLAVRMSAITIRFGDFTAVDSVDLAVEKGTLHAIVGENGAGKTTLMRALYGAVRPHEGAIETEGQVRHWHSSADAIRDGIGMVSQHYSVIPELSCLQNLVLGAEPSTILPIEKMKRRADELAGRLGFRFEWDAPASRLSPAGAQKLEITKLLWRNSRVMILDEPTAMLPPADSDALYASLRQLAQEGSTVIVVTHRIPEVLDHCENVTVLRGGRKVADKKVSDTNADELAQLIVGHAVQLDQIVGREPGAVVLDVENLVVKGAKRQNVLDGASLKLAEGEVLGIAGVDGNGQRELFHAIVGTTPTSAGRVLLCGMDVTKASARARIELGVRLIPEDRHEEALIGEWTLVENAALGLQRLPPLADGAFVDLGAREDFALTVSDKFNTKHTGLHTPLSSLSGGNQQRFVAGRALALGTRVLLAFQPTRGLDIDGTAQVYRAIRTQAQNGAAALIVSFDLDELIDHCDRVVVMHAGRVFEPGSKNRQEIGRLMVGVK